MMIQIQNTTYPYPQLKSSMSHDETAWSEHGCHYQVEKNKKNKKEFNKKAFHGEYELGQQRLIRLRKLLAKEFKSELLNKTIFFGKSSKNKPINLLFNNYNITWDKIEEKYHPRIDYCVWKSK